jgi:hypothetical protein
MGAATTALPLRGKAGGLVSKSFFVMQDPASGKRKLALRRRDDGRVELQTWHGVFPNMPVVLSSDDLRELAKVFTQTADALDRKSGRFS